ncbi:MAG TPA: pyridoxamine 5'-phosphate oxidase family protein [Geminicoccaceae bacterium]|nr:pyridoxamine 5'-phosphate oxidase family protein [Geminicoccus sp.]HMU48597.1 pyridoxamine 5'-phosphate oxidase family protein [Geminicoccaceae bacterium]
MNAYAPTPRTRVKRMPKRGHYEREVVHAILDAALVCHVGYAIDGQPYVTPTAHWRDGERVYWHGSSASRMLRSLKPGGVPVCLTVTHVDGLVLARSAFNHSMNYRSVMALGMAHLVEEPDHKLRALETFVDRLYPGRWAELRPATAQELKATTVLWLDLGEVSAKVRSGPPGDDAEDLAWPCWAGVVPIAERRGLPVADAHVLVGMAVPSYLAQ